MRWIVRAVAVLSVASWIVVAGLFARPVVQQELQATARREPHVSPRALPFDWSRRVLAGSHEVFVGADTAQAQAVIPIVERYARRFDLDPLMVLAVIQVESQFETGAVSADGAMGRVQ